MRYGWSLEESLREAGCGCFIRKRRLGCVSQPPETQDLQGKEALGRVYPRWNKGQQGGKAMSKNERAVL